MICRIFMKSIHVFLVLAIVIAVVINAEAAVNQFKGNVYEFDITFSSQIGIEGVEIIVKAPEGTRLGEEQILTDQNGNYHFKINSRNDPITIIYSHKAYNPYPKRIIQNDLKEKILESVALVKIRMAVQYNASEVLYLSQAVVDVMLIYKPDDQLINVAEFLSRQLYQVNKDVKTQAINIDSSTFYNIHRLMPTNKWLHKTGFLADYLKSFE